MAATSEPCVIALTGLAFASALAASWFAWLAANVRNEGDPIVKMLQPGTRPDNTAGDAMTWALIANDRADTAARDAEGARKFNKLAAVFAVVSAAFSGIAGFVSAFA